MSSKEPAGLRTPLAALFVRPLFKFEEGSGIAFRIVDTYQIGLEPRVVRLLPL
jgi:hypothetical protein